MNNELKKIGIIRTDFQSKFGIPRQSGIVESLKGKIYFEPEYKNPEAFRGLDGFSHIWLLWSFSENLDAGWSATVRPPRLGGNVHMGVFATRSPYRPNGIGLSCVKLEMVEFDKKAGPIIHVSGVDIMDNTPIYDIKPYLAYSDSHPDAMGGFTDNTHFNVLEVVFPQELFNSVPSEKRDALKYVLAQDPRPAYQKDENRRYGVTFAGLDIRFTVKNNILTVCEVEKI